MLFSWVGCKGVGFPGVFGFSGWFFGFSGFGISGFLVVCDLCFVLLDIVCLCLGWLRCVCVCDCFVFGGFANICIWTMGGYVLWVVAIIESAVFLGLGRVLVFQVWIFRWCLSFRRLVLGVLFLV